MVARVGNGTAGCRVEAGIGVEKGWTFCRPVSRPPKSQRVNLQRLPWNCFVLGLDKLFEFFKKRGLDRESGGIGP